METVLSFFKLIKKDEKKKEIIQEAPKPAQEIKIPEPVVEKIPVIKPEIKNNYNGIKSAARGYLDRKKISGLKTVKGYNRIFSGNLSNWVEEKVETVERKHGPFVPMAPFDDGITVHQHPAYIFDDRTIYKGEWNDEGEKHGKGIEISPDGSKYEGYFKFNKKHWSGRLITAEGNLYQGFFLWGKLHGKGILALFDGTQYEGCFKNSLPHGEGIETSADYYYKGSFKNGLRHGKGILCLANGNFYEGNFKKNKKEGKGYFFWNDGKKYEGEWKNDKMHGNGICTWPDGRKYEGAHRDDLEHGYGIFTWPDGKVYIGEWKSGHQDGRGKLFHPTNKSIDPWFGTWKRGQRINLIKHTKLIVNNNWNH